MEQELMMPVPASIAAGILDAAKGKPPARA